MSISEQELKRIIEGVIIASQEPLSVPQLMRLFDKEDAISIKQLQKALTEIAQGYESYSIGLKEVANGYRFQVDEDLTPWIHKLTPERPPRYSHATLETLALIAYRQPITRGEIEQVRGVAVSSLIIKNLLERDWIRMVGHRDVPGKPALYATTKEFLDDFNLKSLDELPALEEIRDLEGMENLLNEQLKLSVHASTEAEQSEIQNETQMATQTLKTDSEDKKTTSTTE